MSEQQTVVIDPEQALSLLDQAVSTIQTNRQGHEVLATCLQVLRQRIVSDKERIEALQGRLGEGCQDMPEGENVAHGSPDEQDGASGNEAQRYVDA